MNKLTILIIGFLVVGGTLAYALNKKAAYNPVKNSQKVCTMDAKMCPDGSYVGRSGLNCEFAQCPDIKNFNPQVKFDAPINLKLNETVEFKDSLKIALIKIEDSMCPTGVQCIWAGEISATLSLLDGELMGDDDSAQWITVGTVNNKSRIVSEYKITLISATTDNIKIVVHSNL